MKTWNTVIFKSAIKNIKASFMQGHDLFDSKGYNLKNTEEICVFLSEELLQDTVTGSTVYEWTKARSKGPREEWQIKKMEEFLGIKLCKEKGEIEMKNEKMCSDLAKEKIFVVHEAVMDYLDEMDEEAFWKMQNTLDRCKIVIPDHVYDVVQSFVHQYLEKDLFGEIYSKIERGDYDLSQYELVEVNCPNPEVGPNHVQWFKLMTMYETIAEEELKPYLI